MKNTPLLPFDFDQANLQIGDIVFTRIDNFVFNKVANATSSWTNHVGIVVGYKDDQYWVAESTIPLSKIVPVAKFVARSKEGSFATARSKTPLTNSQKLGVMRAAKIRMGILYDTGFNLKSKRQFCSRFVYEVLKEAIGLEVGEVENFKTLLSKNPDYGLGFWKIWFLGLIPWKRLTVTPASQFNSPKLDLIYDYRYQERL